MSDRIFPISRRRLLQLAGLAPLAALAASGTSPHALARPGPAIAEIPEWSFTKDLIPLARLRDPNLNEKTFRDVSNGLWSFFAEGVKDNGGSLPPAGSNENDPNGHAHQALVRAAYETRNDKTDQCGDLIVDKLNNWDPWKVNTQICAWVCGAYAAHRSKSHPVTPPDFRFGYKETERRMKTLMARARSIYAKRGETITDHWTQGAGC